VAVIAADERPRCAGLDADLRRLYAEPFPATRTGPLYNAFSYPTKISAEAIGLFIATHTAPGDTVLDVFAGSGSTGIGAILCARPTAAMERLAADLELRPRWGPRRAVLYDIGVLGSFVSRVMCDPPDPQRFAAAAEQLVAAAERRRGWLYEALDPDGKQAKIRHTIWADVLACGDCGERTDYWTAAVREDPASFASRFDCPGCGRTVAVDECEPVFEQVADPILGRPVERRLRVPVTVYGKTGRRTWERPVTDADRALAERAAGEPVPACAPRAEVDLGDLYRGGYHRGISHLHHFYTPRNFLAVATLWELVEDFDEDLRDALRLLVLSFNSTHSTLMTRAVAKKEQRRLVLTGAQSGVLYISSLPVEKNVFEGVRRKAKTLADAFALTHGTGSTVEVHNASSTELALGDGAVDYVFTDPPFGDYIPYAELNQVNELWLGRGTDRAREIIVSRDAGRDVEQYGGLMAEVFGEVARVLKPDAAATVVFHSAKAAVWQALTGAYSAAGLAVRTASVLHKTQASFKQVVSPTTVKGDALILLGRAGEGDGEAQPRSVDEAIAAVLRDSEASGRDDERAPERLFSRFVTRCLAEGIPVTIDVGEFYARAGLEAAE
jgi:adenine-specific DNA methylase